MKKTCVFIILVLSVGLVSLLPVFAEESDLIVTQDIENKDIVNVSNEVVEPMRAQYGTINADGVRLRATPSLSGTVLTLLYTGDIVTVHYTEPVYADGYEWKNVSYNNYGGWVASIYIDEDGR